jgi:uncharacterized RDD family membrane protein YckC
MYTLIGGDGKEYGPVTAANVHDWISARRANLDTRARLEGTTEWKRLGDFPEFSATPSFAPPPLGIPSAIPTSATLPLANLWLRLAGALIDWVLNSICMLPTAFALYQKLTEVLSDGKFSPERIAGAMDGTFAKSVPYLIALAAVQAFFLTTRGQSVGKMAVGTRIVRAGTEAAPGFLHAVLIRSAVPWVITHAFQNPILSFLGTLFWIVDICFIFREDHRCLHDLMADTKVIK